METFNKYKKLLDEIKNIKPIETPDVTFLDIARYPKFENVISNILAFLFDDKIHGFNDLWIRSLLNCYCKVSNIDLDIDSIAVNCVDREVSTEDNKRIDLVIETDKFLIIIENKIYASPYNPFSSYHKFAKKYIEADNLNLEIIEILLSVNTENDKISNDYRFYNITYNMLLTEVKNIIGSYILYSNDKWLMYMKDFMHSIENLEVGASKMSVNKEWNKFIEENNDTISDFFSNYFNDLNNKMKLLDDLTEELNNLSKKYKIGAYNTTYNRISKDSSYASNYVDIKYEDNVFAVESYIMKRPTKAKHENGNYLYVALWNRTDKSYNYDKFLENIELITNTQPEKIETGGWGKHYILKKIDLANDINISDIATLIIKIADSIK